MTYILLPADPSALTSSSIGVCEFTVQMHNTCLRCPRLVEALLHVPVGCMCIVQRSLGCENNNRNQGLELQWNCRRFTDKAGATV
mmetsp:Transcript_67559/g.119850  ORF Transcript_67559/g.119850 Transcript_67559/m.119850 type:complete len:85 (+) Transcript_67559:7826-8080(+)